MNTVFNIIATAQRSVARSVRGVWPHPALLLANRLLFEEVRRPFKARQEGDRRCLRRLRAA